MSEGVKIVVRNKHIKSDYDVFDTYEGGLVLKGTEVKSLRNGKVSIKESYLKLINGEIYIINMDISTYPQASIQANHNPKRVRKVLLNRREIARIIGRVAERGMTLVPKALYFKKGLAKIEFCIVKGRKKFDKRNKKTERDAKKAMRKYLAK